MSLATHDVGNLGELLERMDEYFDDDDRELDYEEFKQFMRYFLPSATDDHFKRMFHNIDVDDSHTISKDELLNSNFFTEFIRTTDKLFTMQEAGLGQNQTDVIQKLQDYIKNTGRPAEQKVEKLEYELASLREEHAHLQRENVAYRDEIEVLRSQEKQYQEEIEVLKLNQRVQEEELHDFEELAQENDETNTELVLLQHELESEQEQTKELQDKLDDLTELEMKHNAEKRKYELEIRKHELDVQRLKDKNDRLEDRLAQLRDKYNQQQEDIDLLNDELVICQSRLAEAEDFWDESDKYSVRSKPRSRSQSRVFPIDMGNFRIESSAFVIDGVQMDSSDGIGDDSLFFEIMDSEENMTMRRQVAMFDSEYEEAPTFTRTRSQTVEQLKENAQKNKEKLKNVIARSRKLKHKKTRTEVDFKFAKSILAELPEDTSVDALDAPATPALKRRRSRSMADAFTQSAPLPETELSDEEDTEVKEAVIPMPSAQERQTSEGTFVKFDDKATIFGGGLSEDDLVAIRNVMREELQNAEVALSHQISDAIETRSQEQTKAIGQTMEKNRRTQMGMLAGLDQVPMNLSEVKSELRELRDELLVIMQDVESVKTQNAASALSTSMSDLKQQLSEMEANFAQQQETTARMISETTQAFGKPSDGISDAKFDELRVDLITSLEESLKNNEPPPPTKVERDVGDEPQWVGQIQDELSNMRKDFANDTRQALNDVVRHVSRDPAQPASASCFAFLSSSSQPRRHRGYQEME